MKSQTCHNWHTCIHMYVHMYFPMDITNLRLTYRRDFSLPLVNHALTWGCMKFVCIYSTCCQRHTRDCVCVCVGAFPSLRRDATTNKQKPMATTAATAAKVTITTQLWRQRRRCRRRVTLLLQFVIVAFAFAVCCDVSYQKITKHTRTHR